MTLASTAQYEAITGVTLVADSAEKTRVETLLDLASAAVLAEADGQLIEATADDEVTLYPFEGTVRFPQRPVTAVSSVVLSNGGTSVTLTAGTDYRWTAGGNRRPAYLIRVRNGHDSYWTLGDVVEVTYSHGWATIPAQIVAIVVAMVKAIVDNDGGASATSETAGPFSESWDASHVEPGAFKLSPSADEVLDDLCGIDGPVSIDIGRGAP